MFSPLFLAISTEGQGLDFIQFCCSYNASSSSGLHIAGSQNYASWNEHFVCWLIDIFHQQLSYPGSPEDRVWGWVYLLMRWGRKKGKRQGGLGSDAGSAASFPLSRKNPAVTRAEDPTAKPCFRAVRRTELPTPSYLLFPLDQRDSPLPVVSSAPFVAPLKAGFQPYWEPSRCSPE